ncbi:MAG: hypothetical protein HY288_02405 [Planctomycetia bacterium]|nr:hypothetical protein [Planctomycetia bacterium]
MRRSLVWCAVVAVWPLMGSTPAAAQFYQQRPKAAAAAPPTVRHFSIGKPTVPHAVIAPNVPPPVSPPSQDLQIEHHHDAGANVWCFWGGGYPYWWTGAFTSPFPYYIYPYPYLPNYGLVPQPRTPAGRALDQLKNDVGEPPAKPKPKVTNAAAKAKAGKFIAFGDANFGKQKYLPAVERYKTAAEMAPDLAEPFLRQGHALVALGQFESAAKAFRRGMKIRSDWSDSGFRLDQIYGADRLAKITHLENLAKAVEANPLDSDLLITLGVQLYFDGQRDRARVFFARAAQLGGNEDRLLNDVLPKPGPAGAPKDQAVGKVVF